MGRRVTGTIAIMIKSAQVKASSKMSNIYIELGVVAYGSTYSRACFFKDGL